MMRIKIMIRYSILLLLFSLAALGLYSNPSEIHRVGVCSGENLFIENPLSNDGKSFVIKSIQINNKEIVNEINTSLIEIDFNLNGYKKGDLININIVYVGNKQPRIVNEESLIPKCDVQVLTARVDKKKQQLEWITVEERQCQLPYIIEQYHWGKWKQIGKVPSTGKDTNYYSIEVNVYSGNNLYRIKQTNLRGETWISKPIKFKSSKPSVIPNVDKAGTLLTFNYETVYEVLNEKGELLKSGKAKSIPIEDLPYKNLYILNYENETVMFYKQ